MLNQVQLIGHLGQDPKVTQTTGGKQVAQFTLATTERWNDDQGQKQEKTEWHKIVVFGKTAEQVGKYLQKGSLVYCQGKLQTRKWQDREGKDQYTTEIVAHEIRFLSPRGDRPSQPAQAPAPAPAYTPPANAAPQPGVDDFPF